MQLFCSLCIISGLFSNFSIKLHHFAINVYTTETTFRLSDCNVRYFGITASIVVLHFIALNGFSKTLQALWSYNCPLANSLFNVPCWGRMTWSKRPHENTIRINKSLLRLCWGEGDLFFFFSSVDHNCSKDTKTCMYRFPVEHLNNLLVVKTKSKNQSLLNHMFTSESCITFLHVWHINAARVMHFEPI